MPPNNPSTDQNRTPALSMQDRERREQGPILTETDLPRLLIHSDFIRPFAAITIRKLADALEHRLNCEREFIATTPKLTCDACDAARDLLRRFKEGS